MSLRYSVKKPLLKIPSQNSLIKDVFLSCNVQQFGTYRLSEVFICSLLIISLVDNFRGCCQHAIVGHNPLVY